MIDPPQVLSEEPTAVTPHGGICGGESQQWLSYPTNPVAYLAAAYALAGREQEAREALGHHLKLWPNTTLKTFEPSIGTAAFNSKMQRVLEGLRLAGLPE